MTDQQQIKEVLTQIQHLPWAGEVWLREAAAIIEESELFGPDADVVSAHDRERRRALEERDRLRERVRELAYAFDDRIDWSDGRSDYGDCDAWAEAARDLRAILDDKEQS